MRARPAAHQALKQPLHARQAMRDHLKCVEQEPNEIPEIDLPERVKDSLEDAAKESKKENAENWI